MTDSMSKIWESLNYNDEKLKLFFEDLFSKYQKGEYEKFPPPTLENLDIFLKERYLAKEVEDETFFGLNKDPMVNVKDIIKMYRINDPKIMEELYTQEEREFQLEIEDEAAENQNRNRVQIILESKDNVNISGYTMQGMSLRLSSAMHVFLTALNKEDVKDINTQEEYILDYLASLWWAGFFI